MTESPSTTSRGMEMTEQEVDAFLKENGYGTLSLADAGNAYAVPISFGYDGERLFMYLVEFGNESEKLDHFDATETGCLTTYQVESQYDWASTIVRGELVAVADTDRKYMEEVMESNAWHPSLFPPAEPTTGIDRVELVIEEATGRKGIEYGE